MQYADTPEAVRQTLTTSQSFLNHQADIATTMLGSRMDEIASSLRKVASQLREDSGAPMVAGLAEQGADAVERMGSYLRGADGQRLVSDAESIARRNPILSASLAYLAGLSLSRFLKTSSVSSRHESGSSSSNGANVNGP